MSEPIVHFGVKGMKWGVRKDKVPSASNKRTQEITEARQRQGKRETSAYKSMENAKIRKTKEIEDAEKRAADTIAKAQKRIDTLSMHPDAVTANLMTRGEKITMGVVGGALGAAWLGGIVYASKAVR